MKTAGSCQYF